MGGLALVSRACNLRPKVEVVNDARRSHGAKVAPLTGGAWPRSHFDLDLGLDLHRRAEGQLAEADRGAGVRPPLRPVELEDELGEAVDHGRELGEAGRRVHHAEDAAPGPHPLEVPQRALQAAQHAQGHLPGGAHPLLQAEGGPHLAQRQIALVVVGVITVGCGFYYYLKVVRAMYWQSTVKSEKIPVNGLSRLTISGLIAATIWLGVYPQPIFDALKR